MPAARVLIDGPSELVFDYAIPDGLPVVPGCRVRVPLRNKLSQGTVLDLVATEDLGFAIRPLHSLRYYHPARWTLLIQLDSNDDLDWHWTDAGSLYFWLPADDLASGRFDRVWTVLKCH
jgi:primosomal protein N'